MIETQLDPAQAMAACLVQWRQVLIDCDDAALQDEVRTIESASRMLHSVMLQPSRNWNPATSRPPPVSATPNNSSPGC